MREGQPDDDDGGQADDRGRQSRLPALLQRRSGRSRRGRAAIRTTARASKARWPSRSRSDSASPRPTSHGSPVPFNNAIAPGDKPFDLYLTQVSYSAEREEAVDLSDGYLDLSQTVIALADNPIAAVTTVAGLKAFKLGAPVGTTSYDYIVENIQPTTEPSVYDTLDAAIQALSVKQIDGVLVDLPTAFFATAVQLENGKIVGTLPTVGEIEHFSVVLDKDSPLTDCVNTALAAMTSDGTLTTITDEWITGAGAPELK